MTTSTTRGVILMSSVSKGLILQPFRVALLSACSAVIVVAYWRSFMSEEQGINVGAPSNLAMNAMRPTETQASQQSPQQLESRQHRDVTNLIAALRREVKKVERNTGIFFPDTDPGLSNWGEANSCSSRVELPEYYSRLRNSSSNRMELGAAESRQWETVLEEYARLHRLCIRAAGNLTEYFKSRNITTGCKFFIADSTNGLGNKLFTMAPSLLYAVLTLRVILIPASTGVPDLMCEPFPGSSWRLPSDIHGRDVPIWTQTNEFLDNVDRAKQEHGSLPFVYASRVDDDWRPVNRFFCDAEQTYFRRVPWLTVHGCLYFLPMLFAIPSLQPTLQALFPDPSVAITHILRTVFLPRDESWAEVKPGVDQSLFNSSRAQIGIQARYLNSSEAKHKVINANVEGCLLENNLLDQARPNTTIFIASLTSDLQEDLRGVLVRIRHTEFGYTNISFVQLSSEKEQRFGLEVYQQVLVEVLWLSFSQTLLVSPTSTLGGLAQAYGALTSWFIETRDDVRMPCQKGQTPDGCFMTVTNLHSFRCPYDHTDHQRLGADLVASELNYVPSYIKPCLEIDAVGVQLVGGRLKSVRSTVNLQLS